MRFHPRPFLGHTPWPHLGCRNALVERFRRFVVLPCAASVVCAACGRPPAAQPAAASESAVGSELRHDASATPSGDVDAPPARPAQAPAAGDSSPTGVPATCADPSAALCTPPSGFVERLCAKPDQDVALALFSKRTPFTRLYLRGRLDELAFEEEVIALRAHHPPKNGMVVGSAAGTYDLMRWDGSCSMGIEAEMTTRRRPARPVTAHVQWHRIAPAMQDALIAGSDAIKRAHAARGRECKGAMSGEVSATCQRADGALVEAIVAYVRAGGALPEAASSK